MSKLYDEVTLLSSDEVTEDCAQCRENLFPVIRTKEFHSKNVEIMNDVIKRVIK